MPRHEHKITHADILPMADYGAMRKAKRAEITELKKNRRLSVGPYAIIEAQLPLIGVMNNAKLFQ